MTFIPRGPQTLAASEVDAYSGELHPMVVMATGTGKTGFALNYAVTRYTAAGKRVLWLAHRKELVEQPHEALAKWWPDVGSGIVKASRDECDRQVVFASKDTLINKRRLDRYLSHGQPSLVVVDEAHHSMAPSWRQLLDGLPCRRLGLTATPEGKGLGGMWDIVYSYSILEAVADGYLTKPVHVDARIPELDLSNVGGRKDYLAPELGRELLRQHVVEHTVAAFSTPVRGMELPFRNSEHSGGQLADMQGMVFTATVEQAQLTAAALRDAGINARWVAGSQAQPEGERARIIRAFKRGQVSCICNAAALTEGTDLPMAEYAVLARPTRSHTLFVQIAGRALRKHEGHEYGWVVDLVGACEEHSLVSAPVLIGGHDCQHSPDGQHRYLPVDGDVSGVCQHCESTVACIERKGPHLFERGRCKTCGAPQCPDSPELEHHWVPWEDFKLACLYCDATVPDPLGGLASRRRIDKVDAAWKRLNVPGLVYAVHMGETGILYNVEDNGEWSPVWLCGATKRVHPLSTGPVAPEHAQLLCADVLRKAGQINEVAGARHHAWQYRRAYREAEEAWREAVGGKR